MTPKESLSPHDVASLYNGDRSAESATNVLKLFGKIALGAGIAFGVYQGANAFFGSTNIESCQEARATAQNPQDPDLSFTTDRGITIYCNLRPLE